MWYWWTHQCINDLNGTNTIRWQTDFNWFACDRNHNQNDHNTIQWVKMCNPSINWYPRMWLSHSASRYSSHIISTCIVYHMWSSTTKWGSWVECQKWEKYFIAIYTISTHFDAKIIPLRYSYQKLQNVEHRHVQYHS